MKKVTPIVLLLSGLLMSQNVLAGVIQNGNFSTCDYSGWNKDTDGSGDISTGNDFTIDNTGTACRAAIEVDAYESAGDPFSTPLDDVWFANTLYQALDFSGASSSTFTLSIDFSVDSQLTSPAQNFVSDYFVFGLNDGTGNYYDQTGAIGYLVNPTDIDGLFSNTLTFNLDSSFTNMAGWFLDLQVNVGIADDGFSDAFSSTLYVNEVTLTEVLSPTTVPEPTTFAMFLIGFTGLIKRKSTTK